MYMPGPWPDIFEPQRAAGSHVDRHLHPSNMDSAEAAVYWGITLQAVAMHVGDGNMLAERVFVFPDFPEC